jgi:hypothetical protein
MPRSPASKDSREPLRRRRSTRRARTSSRTGSAAGSRKVNLPCTFIPDLPDANGYDRLVTLANDANGDPFNIRIIDAADSDNVVFECSVTVSDRNNTLDQNAAAGATCTFENAAAPVTDDL